MGWINIERVPANPIINGAQRITPEALIVRVGDLRSPFGLVFNRPIAVRVEDEDGQVKTLPIINYTRLAAFVLLALGAIGTILISSGRKHD